MLVYDPYTGKRSIVISNFKEASGVAFREGAKLIKMFSEKPIEIGGEVAKRAFANGRDAFDKAADKTKKYPRTGLLIACGVGFLLAKLLKFSSAK